MNLLHIAVCTVLAPYGYYEFEGRDPEGWPHYKILKKLPALKGAEQNNLLIRAVVEYFKEQDIP